MKKNYGGSGDKRFLDEAEALYNAGYRKQDEVLKAFVERLKEKYGKSCSEYYPLFIECTSEDLDELLKECITDEKENQ